ncbi:Serine/threonine protein kinase [Lachnospiraceae bacterium XBB2008]|nr:Serine/threonine protein kinase [Lachnospiraceae bacterium XBB2008]
MNQRALKPLTVLNGKYLIGKVLGEGGFGITYLGLDLTLNMKVAIKEYFPIQFASRNVYESNSNDIVVISGKSAINYQRKLERYEEEAKRLARLENLAGIVRVNTFFYENNTAYNVMEYVPGQNLLDYKNANKGQIHWKEALDIIEPMIKSLSVLHRNDIIHRDITPDNIMITDQKELVIIDFGTAVEIEEDDKSKEIELKRGYAPPEQYTSHGNQGPWTDVYEVCATLYYMISGKVPPDALAILDKNAKIASLKDYDPSIPANIEAAIMKGLDVDVKYRIKNMDELYEHLYNGRRVIPWRKIGFASVIAVSVIALLLIVRGIFLTIVRPAQTSSELIENVEQTESETESSEYIDGTDEQSTVTIDTDITSVDETESDIVEEPVEIDTAADYIRDNGLNYTDSSLLKYSDNGNGITITGSDNSLTDIVIPEEIGGEKVTAISGIGGNVTSLVLPDTLESIENATFRNCVYLESIYIPASVTSIGKGAFEGCMSLSDIRISNGNSIYHVENGSIVDSSGNKYD